ncbi:MAG TPA: ribosome-associated translation inhibitor RaiA [Polyangiaceae bacterium]|nr:ribosome-associated translation inhibitor RaiA [Polyangiaceae bacterium]
MDLSTTFRHIEPTDALRDYAEQKVSRLQKFLRQPMTARITLSAEKHEHIAEIQLQSGGLRYEAREASGDMYGSIDSAVHKLERQIHDAKGVAGSKRRRETDLRHTEAEAEQLAMAAAGR